MEKTEISEHYKYDQQLIYHRAIPKGKKIIEKYNRNIKFKSQKASLKKTHDSSFSLFY